MNCLQCAMYGGTVCKAAALARAELNRPLPPAPLGSCMLPIVEGYLKKIQPRNAHPRYRLRLLVAYQKTL